MSQVKSTPVNNHYIIGLIPFLYVATSFMSSLFTVLVVAFIFVASMVSVYLTRRFIPYRSKYLFFIVISLTWVCMSSLLLEAWLYPVQQSLSVYLFIIPMNTTLLCCLDDCIHEESSRLFKPIVLCMLAGIVFGSLREWLSQGSIKIELNTYSAIPGGQECMHNCAAATNVSLFAYSTGALLLAGLLLAVVNKFSSVIADKRAAP